MRKKVNKKLKSNKGITMITLTIAIIILAILTSMIAYYSTDATDIKKLNNMYNDIEQLEEKVSLYFYENEKIPMLIEYPEVITILGEQRRNLDGDKYYVLDLSKLKNIELNYGKDFEKIKANNSDVQNYKDIYVINEESHNIYYLNGIEVEGKTYYIRTQPDEEEVAIKVTKISSIEDLVRFKQNVEAGKTYENQYVVMTKNLDFENPNSYDGTEITIDSVIYTYGGENDLQTYFSESGTSWTPIGDDENTFLGVFLGNNYKITNIYTASEENKIFLWTAIGKIPNLEVEWKMSDEGTPTKGIAARTVAWVPSGFSIVRGTDFSTGVTMANTTNGIPGTQNYVWIEIPRTISANVTRNGTETTVTLANAKNDTEIYTILEAYAGDYIKGSSEQNRSAWKEEWYDFYNTTWDGKSEYAYIGVSTTSVEDISNYYSFDKWEEYYGGEVYTSTSKDVKGTMTKVDFTIAAYDNTAYYFTKVNEAFKKHDDGCGLTYEAYKKAYSSMLKSIQKNGGFWLAQYEAGIKPEEVHGTNRTNRIYNSPRITEQTSANYAKNQYAFNWVYCSEAQKIADADSTSQYTSSLPFGIQWDLVCKFLETKTELEYKDIATASAWGNYVDTFYKPNPEAKYSTNNGATFNLVYNTNAEIQQYEKTESVSILLTTGAIEATSASVDTSPMNIYDFAGNVWEWTLERSTSSNFKPCAFRGGDYNDITSRNPASKASGHYTTCGHAVYSFRSVLY